VGLQINQIILTQKTHLLRFRFTLQISIIERAL